MSDFDAVVIGAGNGGLTAALTLARAGVKTLLLERHNIPGGCATSFVRGRFEFEVALHQLSGIGTSDFPGPLLGTLKDLGVADEIELVEMENLYRSVLPGKLDLVLKADRAESMASLKTRFPQEADQIEAFYDLVYEYCNQWIQVTMVRDPEASPQKYPTYFKYALKPMQEVLDQFFSDPLLKATVGIYWCYLGLPPKSLPFGEFAVAFWAYIEFKPWHIKGGSQMLSNALLNGFIKAGGEVRFNCGAEKILVENGETNGVVTEGGDKISTKIVISNAGMQKTYVDLIDEEQVPPSRFQEIGARSVGVSAVSVFIGFDRTPEELGITETTNFLFTSHDSNSAYEDTKTLNAPTSMLFTCYDIDDPGFSPEGCCQGALIALAYGEPWLKIPPNRYHDVKYQYGQEMLKVLYKVFPKCERHIEEIDMGTPLTHMRYLGHPGGAIYGFDQFAKDSEHFLERKSPIKGLFHAGAWVGSGGFQPTLMSGAAAARASIRLLKS